WMGREARWSIVYPHHAHTGSHARRGLLLRIPSQHPSMPQAAAKLSARRIRSAALGRPTNAPVAAWRYTSPTTPSVPCVAYASSIGRCQQKVAASQWATVVCTAKPSGPSSSEVQKCGKVDAERRLQCGALTSTQ